MKNDIFYKLDNCICGNLIHRMEYLKKNKLKLEQLIENTVVLDFLKRIKIKFLWELVQEIFALLM